VAFTIPNSTVAAYPAQAQVDAVDFDIMAAGLTRNGVATGCAVTPQGSPDMTVAVAAGTVIVADAVPVAVTGGNVTVTAAHASLARFDLIVANNAGAKSCTAGTAAATPVFPAIPANSVVLAAVYVPANATTIQGNQIVDKRVILVPTVTYSAFTTQVVKPSDESVISSTVLQNDDHLLFAVGANEVWFVELILRVEAVNTTGDFKHTFTVPAGAAITGYGFDTGTTGAANFDGFAIASSAATLTSQTATNTNGTMAGIVAIRWTGWVVTAGTAGTVQFQWAQNTSDANNVTVKKGSVLRASKA
jgi:hypothetical protein